MITSLFFQSLSHLPTVSLRTHDRAPALLLFVLIKTFVLTFAIISTHLCTANSIPPVFNGNAKSSVALRWSFAHPDAHYQNVVTCTAGRTEFIHNIHLKLLTNQHSHYDSPCTVHFSTGNYYHENIYTRETLICHVSCIPHFSYLNLI